MREVLISIKPKWCELIVSGKKTVEVRKTKPKLETPFKVYIYETLGKTKWCNTCKDPCERPYPNCACHEGWGKVIGEFVCDRIDRIGKRGCDNNFDYCYLSLNVFGNDDIEIEITDIQRSCIEKYELNAYGTNSPHLYAWHITDLVVYDKPRELCEFYTLKKCNSCESGYESTACIYDEDCKVPVQITRPPQSWCYIETRQTAD